MAKRTPSYRQRKGYDQAIVTLRDSATGYRRDYWLGPYDSPDSRERYHRLIAEWESNGRHLPEPIKPERQSDDLAAPSLNEILLEYWRWAQSYYSPSEVSTIASAIRIVRQLFGKMSAADFGPNRLRLVRDEMVRGNPKADRPRSPWTRKHVNGQVHRICAVFKWAASHELLPATIYQQLKTVPALRRGRSSARESEPVQPVPIEDVEAVRPFLSWQVNGLISLQLHSGARGGELFKLRTIDINMHDDASVWTIEPADHKTAHHGHSRTIFLGPRAQMVIEPFLTGRSVDAYLFSPVEAEAERLAKAHAARTTPASCGNGPGTNRKESPERTPGGHYTADSYRRAIQRACDQAFPPLEHLQPSVLPNGKRETKKAFLARLSDPEQDELRNWRKKHRWHPHQLRHTAGTLIRREFGLEAAQLALGHSSAKVTDAVYAERDMSRVIEVMKKIG